jgi:arylsulfatase A-like enzyme
MSTPGAQAPSRPNILVLFADDLRADALGAYGNHDALTPHIDRLAQQGTLFTRAYGMGADQGAVCVPSRAMLLSGRSLFRVDTSLTNTRTWPTALREAGYTTHFTGKWHNGTPSAIASFPGARSVFLGGMSDPFTISIVDLDASPGATEKGTTAPRTADRHASEVFADEAVRFIRSNRARPWALYLAFTAPHDPRVAPAAWHRRFDASRLTLPSNLLPDHPFDNGELKVRDELLEKRPLTTGAVRRHWADYHAAVAHMDDQIGRVLAALDDTGQTAGTVIVFASDNGLALGSHGLLGKQNLYEHSVRLPVIVSGGGIPAGAETDALCYLLDLGPTLAEFGGARLPEDIDGRSLLPVLRGERATHRDSLLLAYGAVQRAVRDERYKAIWYPTARRWQLFDLDADPQETRDLAEEPATADVRSAMQRKLTDLRVRYGDTGDLTAPKSSKP